MTIDSLLLTITEKSAKETLLLNNKHKIFRLKSPDELYKTQLNETDYYELRLNQLCKKYLKIPNPHSFGTQRPCIDFGEVAYLNLDVVSFTAFCASHSVDLTMLFLSQLFNRFDQRIRQAKSLIQVKISGDSYEILSLPVLLKRYYARISFDDAKMARLKRYEAVVQLICTGLGFIKDCQRIIGEFEQSQGLGLRIGIAMGEVTGSLLGNKMCRFDAVGKPVVEAEQCQVLTEKNTIMLSEEASRVFEEGREVLKDYIVEYITAEELKNHHVKIYDEMVQFDFRKIDERIIISGIKK